MEKTGAYTCTHDQFYLNIPGVARYLALPEKNCIIIERIDDEIHLSVLNGWLLGTVMAYLLQYHGYLVLHGSAILMNGTAAIFSGQSGAGKSTLAHALVQKGYSFITDDLVVIKRNAQGQYCILPGPTTLKLWEDAMQHFNQDINKATPVSSKEGKYAVPVANSCNTALIPISAFYEINISHDAETYHCERLNAIQSLKTLLHNAYRYFMLKPLGKSQEFFQDCSILAQQIAVYQLTRTAHFHEMEQIIQHIKWRQELDESVTLAY